ncbi:FMN-binding protein [Sporolactobacillus vineae]|uniref:FMN-binding protein n=1 Tax=Sporolactobacillus vineae TaxID=444463 RepID=UPI0002895922|nr:FMN-binding protein [Sporolactobacillus vineae]
MAKLRPEWIALCTAAIGLAYSAGYVVTEPRPIAAAPASHSVQVQSDNRASASAGGESASEAEEHQGRTTQKKQNRTTATTIRKKSGYKDGTYSGQGMNRIGAVAVSVTIKQGKIASVQITDCTTSYPEIKIDQLPAQVVSRQNANVDNVSGATESTSDFVTAVAQALTQAKA